MHNFITKKLTFSKEICAAFPFKFLRFYKPLLFTSEKSSISGILSMMKEYLFLRVHFSKITISYAKKSDEW